MIYEHDTYVPKYADQLMALRKKLTVFPPDFLLASKLLVEY